MKKRRNMLMALAWMICAGVTGQTGVLASEENVEMTVQVESCTSEAPVEMSVQAETQENAEMTAVTESIHVDGDDINGLCAEDRYILLCSGEGEAEIYDYQGNYIDSCRCGIDPLQVAATVKKDSLLAYSDGTTCSVYSFSQLKNILDFAAEYYNAYTCGSVCMVVKTQDGSFTVFDNQGNALYASKANWVEGNQGYGRIVRMDNGYLLGICPYEDFAVLESASPVWISSDGTQVKEIDAPNIQAAFHRNEVEGFGENVIVSDWMAGNHEIYSLNGECLMTEIDNYLYPFSTERNAFELDITVELVAKNENGIYTFYDKKLNEMATVSAGEDYYPEYAGGFLTGVAYEELGGRICKGFVYYNGDNWVPYAESENGCIVYANGETVEFSLGETESLSCFTDTFVVVGNFVDGNYEEDLYDRRKNERLHHSYWDETGGASIQLGAGGYWILESTFENDTYTNKLSVWNNEKELCLQSDTIQCYQWQEDYLVMAEGTDYGIADYSGNWMIHTTAEWAE